MVFRTRKRAIILLWVFGVVCLIYIGLLQCKIYQYAHKDIPEKADYLIVLGARVKGTVPSLAFASRINTAAKYLKANKNTIVIASGGKGPGERISEAESTKRELLKKGINKSRIILENQSTNTYENIKFSKAYIPKTAKTGIVVTNNFHIYRSIMIAKDQNLDVDGLPAKTPIKAIPKSYIREYMAITNYYIEKILK